MRIKHPTYIYTLKPIPGKFRPDLVQIRAIKDIERVRIVRSYVSELNIFDRVKMS